MILAAAWILIHSKTERQRLKEKFDETEMWLGDSSEHVFEAGQADYKYFIMWLTCKNLDHTKTLVSVIERNLISQYSENFSNIFYLNV